MQKSAKYGSGVGMDKIKMDAPFVEHHKEVHAARRYGSVPVSFLERTLDLRKATARIVSVAAFHKRNIDMATMVMQNRDNNSYSLIYFVGPEEGFPIKIGVSDKPWTRLSGLQTGNWQKLVMHGALWTNGVSSIVEKAAHRIARKAGILERGEWVWSGIETAIDMVLEAAVATEQKLLTPAMVIHNQGMAMLARDKAAMAQDEAFLEPRIWAA